MLAEQLELRQVAKWTKRAGSLAYREQWIRRLLEARFLTQEHVYQPFLKQALAGYRARPWHLVIDRSTLDGKKTDWLAVCLSYRKRAIPLVWECVPYGGVANETQVALVERCLPLLPAQTPIVLHGDAEFGHAAMRRFARQQGWDFILGQRAHHCFRRVGDEAWRPLSMLPMTPRQTTFRADIQLTKTEPLPAVHLVAFYAPYRITPQRTIRQQRYFATSLPITRPLRRLGRRRWGIEPFFCDHKSAGWHFDHSAITHPRRRMSCLIILATCYLWLTCLGRWLCKTGQRTSIDPAAHRHYSLFRLGLDWLIQRFRMQQPCPHLLTLYS